LLGSEPDFFLKGIYFSDKPIVTVGGGIDYQGKAVRKVDGTIGTYMAFSGDIFAEYPFSADDELIFKGNFFNYGEGASPTAGATALLHGGMSFYAEAGIRHEWIEPLAFIEYLQGKDDSLKILAPHAGVNFWVKKHNFNVKFDVGYRKTDTLEAAGTVTHKDIFATTQAQVYF
jgi:hypothetical protein